MNHHRRTAVLLLLNFGGAAVMPPVLSKLLLDSSKHQEFTGVQNFGIAALTFIALALIEIVIELEELRSAHAVQREIVASRNALEAELGSIRDVCVSQGDSLMGAYCGRSVRDLKRTIEATVGGSEIQVDERSLFIADIVVDRLRGRPEDVVRLIHRFADNPVLLRAHELEWIRKVDERARQHQITQVRRLMVFRDESDFADDISQSLIAAHLGDKSYNCRLIREDYLAELLKDHQVSPDVIDFGTYGKETVFKSFSYRDGGLQGAYTVEPLEIEQLIFAFDACWKSAVAFEPDRPAAPGDNILPKTMKAFLNSARRWSESRQPIEPVLEVPSQNL